MVISIGNKEAEALLGIAHGKSYKELGNFHSVKNQLYKIRKKLAVSTNIEAIILMIKIANIRKENHVQEL